MGNQQNLGSGSNTKEYAASSAATKKLGMERPRSKYLQCDRS